MKKIIKTGLFLIAIMFVLAITGMQVSNAGPCQDICTPKENKQCIARGEACFDFESMKPIGGLDP